jgi:predicted TIM-barrel fold metal-dependent hydrolase
MHDAESLARANAYLASLIEGNTDRLIGFAVINPRLPGAVALTRRVLGEHALRGLKMVPSGWVPADEADVASRAALTRSSPSRASVRAAVPLRRPSCPR